MSSKPVIRRSRRFAAAVLVAALASGAGLVSCSSAPPLDISAEAQVGLDLSKSHGCTACHGSQGQGASGPTWEGLYGSQVELQDGSFVTADDEYLRRAIKEPDADLLANWSLRMPTNNMSDAEVDSVITFIKELKDVGESN